MTRKERRTFAYAFIEQHKSQCIEAARGEQITGKQLRCIANVAASRGVITLEARNAVVSELDASKTTDTTQESHEGAADAAPTPKPRKRTTPKPKPDTTVGDDEPIVIQIAA